MKPIKKAPRTASPATCEHRTVWKFSSLSSDGSKRYGICPACQSQVEESVADRRSVPPRAVDTLRL